MTIAAVMTITGTTIITIRSILSTVVIMVLVIPSSSKNKKDGDPIVQGPCEGPVLVLQGP